jgi:hypothetical protein
MIHLKTLNRSAKRLARGLVAIFVIKLALIGGVMVFQACESDKEDFQSLEKEEALLKFENVVKDATPKIRNLVKEHLTGLPKNEATQKSVERRIQVETKRIMMPLVAGTKELLKAYDIDESELQQEFADPTDPRIALVGLFLLAAENEEKRAVTVNFAQVFGTSSYANTTTVFNAATSPSVTDCMIKAVGIDVVLEFVNGNVTKAIAKKAIKKIASRVLGYIGAAIAVYEFGSCMEWY